MDAVVFACGYLGPAAESELAPLMEPFRGAGGGFVALEFPKQDLERRVLEGTLDEAVDVCVRQALALQPSRVILAGQSLGGTVALLAGARLVGSGHASLLDGIACFSPVLSPRSWYSSVNYDFIDDPRQAPSGDSLFRVHRRGRYSLVARRFWDSVQRNPLDRSGAWMAPLAQAGTAVLIFLGLHDRQWDDGMVACLKEGIPGCEVRFESQSRHHFRGAAGLLVARCLVEWLDEPRALASASGCPGERNAFAAIAFDWDRVLGFAKGFVDEQEALRQALFSFAADDTSLWNGEIAPERAWADLQRELDAGALQRHWRACVFRLGDMLCPSDPALRVQLTIALAAQYLHQHRELLREVYRDRGSRLTPGWAIPLLQGLRQRRVRLFLSSHSMLDEVVEEVGQAGLAHYFEGVYGYPVRKIEALKAISRRLVCEREKVFLVDDAWAEVVSASREGFSSVFVATNGVPDDVRRMPRVRVVRQGRDAFVREAMERALWAADVEMERLDPQELARRFLGPQACPIGRLLNRFGDNPIWRVWLPGTKETCYLKVLAMKRDEADRLARILLALRQDGLPVARWLPVGESWCIALAPGRCVVMEEALPGRSIAREDLTDAQLAETARTLARFHASVAEIARPLGPFRPDFAARLDTFGQLVVELWRLLAYARHHLRYESKGNPDLRSILGWLDGRGEAIWQRFERVSKELEAALKTVDDQPVLGDFNATNVLFEGGQLSGVVDYEDVHHGPRELDVLGYCLFGLSEPHLPDRLDEFVDAYLGENPGGLQVRALGPIARAICNAQLWRRLQRELSASLLSPGPLQSDVPGMLDRLDKLCLDLEHFD